MHGKKLVWKMSLLTTLLMTCKDATYLHTKRCEGKLSFSERLGLRMHLLICSLCAKFFEQADELEKCTHQTFNGKIPQHTASDACKQRMKQALDSEMQ